MSFGQCLPTSKCTWSFERLAVHQLAIGLTSHSAVCGSRHVRIKAAPTCVRLAGEKRVAASPGIEKGDTAAQSAAALADDESDDEADREVKSNLHRCYYVSAGVLAFCSYPHHLLLLPAFLVGSSRLKEDAVTPLELILESK